jgi:hypothetical protein
LSLYERVLCKLSCTGDRQQLQMLQTAHHISVSISQYSYWNCNFGWRGNNVIILGRAMAALQSKALKSSCCAADLSSADVIDKNSTSDAGHERYALQTIPRLCRVPQTLQSATKALRHYPSQNPTTLPYKNSMSLLLCQSNYQQTCRHVPYKGKW